MNINKIYEIEKTMSVPFFSGESIMFFKDNKLLVSCNNDMNILSKRKFKDQVLFKEKNGITQYNCDEGIYIINPKDLSETILWRKRKYRARDFGQWICEENILLEENKIDYILFDLNSKDMVFETCFLDGRNIRHIKDNFFISDVNTTYLERIDLPTLQPYWRFEFEKSESASGSIHRHNNILLIPSTTLDEYGFIEDYYLRAIDLETGKVLWKEATNNQFCHDKKTGLMYSFWGCFTIVDPNKGIVFNEKIIETSGANNVKPISRLCHLEYPYLYFCTDNHHEKPVHFGRIDIESKILDFMIPSNIGPEVKFSDFAYHNQRFYLLDMKNVLHIYEMNE